MKLGRRKAKRPHGRDPRYQSGAWRRYRVAFLARHPLCIDCGGIAEVVDHILPAATYTDVGFFDASNHQPMCHRCHNSKRGKESHQPRTYNDVRP